MRKKVQWAMALTLLLASVSVHAAEGMWTLDNLPIQALGRDFKFEPDPAWVERVQLSSVRLANGCSGSFVSKKGLVLTNHHCITQCIEDLSSNQRNLMQEGFYSKSASDELQCPNMELNKLVKITDVTKRVVDATKGLSGTQFADAQRAEMNRIEQACAEQGDANTIRCDVVSLYHGGQYHLYRYKRYQDVRLVWAPEVAIAFFGGDPDNFNFPRYVLDASFLRAYENGKAAKTDHYFKWNAKGAIEDELVFVTGHPGATQRLLTVAQLEMERDIKLVDRLLYISELRGMLNQWAKLGEEEARVAQNDLYGIENAYKAFRGRLRALQDPQLFAYKQAEEQALRSHAAKAAAHLVGDDDPWAEIAAAQQKYRELYDRHTMIEVGRGFRSKLFTMARHIVRGAEERSKPNDQRLREYRESALPSLTQSLFSQAPIYPEYEKLTLGWSLMKLREELGSDAPVAQSALGKKSPQMMAEELISGTGLLDVANRRKLWEGGLKAVSESDDPLILLAKRIDKEARSLRKDYEEQVSAVDGANGQKIAAVLFHKKGTDTYPDATFTLRLSYGQVRGWDEGGKPVPPFTKLGGVFDRHTGYDPFALPATWLKAKDKFNLEQPMNFVTTQDIIGGNSGSPIINRKAEVVGLVFDGNIHSLGGAYWYDERLNRAVSVHSGFIIESLRTMYGADRILKELGQ